MIGAAANAVVAGSCVKADTAASRLGADAVSPNESASTSDSSARSCCGITCSPNQECFRYDSYDGPDCKCFIPCRHHSDCPEELACTAGANVHHLPEDACIGLPPSHVEKLRNLDNTLRDGDVVSRDDSTVAVAAPCLSYLIPIGRDVGEHAFPSFENGRAVGWKLSVSVDGTASKIGLRSGDIWTSVDDLTITDPTSALDAYQRFASNKPGKVVLHYRRAEADRHVTIIAVDRESTCRILKELRSP